MDRERLRSEIEEGIKKRIALEIGKPVTPEMLERLNRKVSKYLAQTEIDLKNPEDADPYNIRIENKGDTMSVAFDMPIKGARKIELHPTRYKLAPGDCDCIIGTDDQESSETRKSHHWGCFEGYEPRPILDLWYDVCVRCGQPIDLPVDELTIETKTRRLFRLTKDGTREYDGEYPK